MQAAARQDERVLWRRWVIASTAGWFAGSIVGFIVADLSQPVFGIGPLQGVLGYAILGVFLGSGAGLMQWRVLRGRISGTGGWMMASAPGLAIAGGAGYGAAVLAFGYSEGLEGIGSAVSVLGWTVVFAFGGALTGILQWRVLRQHVSRAASWVLASTIGWGLSMAVAGTVMAAAFLVTVGAGTTPPSWVMTLSFFGGLIAGGVVLGAITGSALIRLLRKPAL